MLQVQMTALLVQRQRVTGGGVTGRDVTGGV